MGEGCYNSTMICKICNKEPVLIGRRIGRVCYTTYRKEYRQRNKTKIREYDKKWRIKNPEYRKLWRREARKKNPEAFNRAARNWKQKHKESVNITALKYRRANPEKMKVRRKRYYDSNPAFQAYVRKATATRRLRIKIMDDKTITNGSLAVLFEKQKGVCPICGLLFQGRPQLDHKLPLSKGGAHSINNVQFTHAFCNLSKNNKKYD